eukprot:COSAG06_NODE_3863_length_4821_cov_12.885006_1_plen_505_part_00
MAWCLLIRRHDLATDPAPPPPPPPRPGPPPPAPPAPAPPVPPGNFISSNPLRNLPPLPKVHHVCEGIDGSYIMLDDPLNPEGTNSSAPPVPRREGGTNLRPIPKGAPQDGIVAPATVALEAMVDFARIMGSFPAMLDAAGTLETAVQVCLNASALHPDRRLPYLYVGGSPFISYHNDPTDTKNDAEEVRKLRESFSNTSALLAKANAKLGSNVTVGMASFDIEAFGWQPNWLADGDVPKPGKQPILDALRRKYELIANMTKEVFPGPILLRFDDYGAAWWQPTGSSTGCYNIRPRTGPDVCSTTRASGNSDGFDSCPDGWCTDLSFTFNESFAHDPGFAFSVDLYQPWDPHLTQKKFAQTAAGARAHGLRGENVVPVLSLGASYHRNTSHRPDINFMAKEVLRGFPFFDFGNFDFTGNGNGAPGGEYDLAWSMLLGAQVNNPKFGSNTSFSALGPWEQATGATFFPSIFDFRASPSDAGVPPNSWNPPGTSSTVVMDHFIAYVC